MRKNSQKYVYNRFIFGRLIRTRRLALGWSYRQLTQHMFEQTRIRIAAATILHVERGARSLPEAQRAALERVLSSPTSIEGLRACEERTEIIAPVPANDPAILESMEHWEAARDEWLKQANESEKCGNWPDWADSNRHAAMMELTLGRYGEADELLRNVVRSEPHLIGREALAETYQDRGWLHMAQNNFTDATRDLLQSARILRKLEIDRTRTLHFLGRTYCAWGIVEDKPGFREAGRALLERAYSSDQQLQNAPGMGYDLLQQIPSMIYDDSHLARKYLAESQDLLGFVKTAKGHYHSCAGLLEQYSNRLAACTHWEQACEDYSSEVFYPNGLSKALRLLVSGFDEQRETLPRAASYALAATMAYPYVQSLDLLEEIASRVFLWGCDCVVSRFTRFWEDQLAKAREMGEFPYTFLRGLAARPDGPKYLVTALRRARVAIRAGLPLYLTSQDTRIVVHCLPATDAP